MTHNDTMGDSEIAPGQGSLAASSETGENDYPQIGPNPLICKNIPVENVPGGWRK
jgi:hypothetical protein